MNRSKGHDWIFFVTIGLAGLLLVVARRAYMISSGLGYDFWSYETWDQMKLYLLLGVGLIVFAIVRYKSG
jgi:hypothetical protein